MRRHISTVATVAALSVLGFGFVAGCKKEEKAPEAPKNEQVAPAPEAAKAEGGAQAVVAGGAHQFDVGDKLGLAGAPVKGPADALVTIVEFASYQCPFCGRVQPTLKELETKFAGQVRFVFKQHPLPNQQNSGPAAEAALEAHAQGKFWEFHDKLMANQQAISRPDLEKYAAEFGMNVDALKAALDSGKYKEQVQKDVAIAGANGIRGTPNFLINGKNVAGAQPVANFATVITEEIDAMKKLMAGGKTLQQAYTERLTANLAAKPAAPAQPAQPDPAAKMFVPLENSPIKGGKEPLVTLVEFSSYQCPFCNKVRATTDQLKEQYGDDLAIVFKHRPLDFQANSGPAALASIAAQNQGKFWEYHDKVFTNQREITPENLTKWAQELGLDMAKFAADSASDATKARLKQDTDLADRLVAQGTPHFFVNGYRLRGAQPIEAFKAIIDREIAVSKGLIEAGTPRAGVYAKQQENAIKGPPPMTGGGAAAPAQPTGPVDIKVGDSVAIGNKDAKVVVVEFSDYKCGFCGKLGQALSEVKPTYKDRVLFVKKQFPLGRWPESQKAAEGAIAAHAQGKYEEFNLAIYAKQREFNDAMLLDIAKEAGLNVEQFKADLDSGKYAAQVAKDQADGRAVGVNGTPALFLNGVKIGGALPADQIKAQIDAALAK